MVVAHSASCVHLHIYISHLLQITVCAAKQHDGEGFRELPRWLHDGPAWLQDGLAWSQDTSKTLIFLRILYILPHAFIFTSTALISFRLTVCAAKQNDGEGIRELPRWLHDGSKPIKSYKVYRILYKTYEILYKTYIIVYKAYNILYKT